MHQRAASDRLQHLSDLARQARSRCVATEHLQAENRTITQQSAKRLTESRALLDRARLRGARGPLAKEITTA